MEDGAIPNLAIKDIEPSLEKALRTRASRNGRSVEAELDVILRDALKDELPRPSGGLASAIHRRFAALGGVELPPHPAVSPRETKME